MKVAITGGAGFVARHVDQVLRENRFETRMVDSRPNPNVPGLEIGDVREYTDMRRTLRGADVVLHLAGVSNTREALEDPGRCHEVNVGATWTVLMAAKQAGVKRVVLAGSTLVSGALLPFPLMDPRAPSIDEAVDELSPVLPGPKHPYVLSKLAAEEAAVAAPSVLGGLEFTVMRYGIQYGPAMTPGVLFDTLIRKALRGETITVDGDGNQWRQYMHVEDLALAHLAVLQEWDQSRNEVFNVCPMTRTSVRGAVRAVERAVGCDLKVEHGPERRGDIPVKFSLATKIEQRLGWRPGWSLQRGVQQTVDWYRRNEGR